MIVIFDLDGTLCNIEHRLHFIKSDTKDWNGFFNACDDDEPVPRIIEILGSLKNQGHTIWIWSGRSDIAEKETVSWLYSNDIEFDRLVMRKEGDHQPDHKLKKSWLKKYFPINTDNLLCVFDDRQQVVDMWRDNGVVCCQVAKGDF